VGLARLGERRDVPLSVYALAEPDLLAANGPRVLAHLNAHHSVQLRRLAARLSGRGPGCVAAATLGSVDRAGAVLRWIDTDGAQLAAVTFDREAATVPDLVDALQRAIRG
jgi:hypothetical protein